MPEPELAAALDELWEKDPSVRLQLPCALQGSEGDRLRVRAPVPAGLETQRVRTLIHAYAWHSFLRYHIQGIDLPEELHQVLVMYNAVHQGDSG